MPELKRGHEAIAVRLPAEDDGYASTFARYPGDAATVLTVVHSPASPSFLELPVTTD